MTANGGADLYPIPWLDKNGSHNQPAGPDLGPSHIYHFKGRVARCSTFTGMRTDNQKIGSHSAVPQPITASCRPSIGLHEPCSKAPSP
jgi:hypothetical protein